MSGQTLGQLAGYIRNFAAHVSHRCKTARENGNAGLGLPIIRALLAAHAGGIELLRFAGGAGFVSSLPPLEPA